MAAFWFQMELAPLKCSLPLFIPCTLDLVFGNFNFICNERSVMVAHTEMIKVCGLYEGVKDLMGDISADKQYNSHQLFPQA